MLRDVLRHLFAIPPAELHFAAEAPAVAEHVRAVREATAELTGCERAFAGGYRSDRIGTAFGVGYTHAVGALVKNDTAIGVFAVTERGGGAPAAVHTTLTWQPDGSGTVRGEKTFVTLGRGAERVYVVATEGVDESGRNRLRLVRVDSQAPGLTWLDGPALPIVPEVEHARLQLDHRVAAHDVFPGDAYVEYVKPFRTTEDVYVHAALCGHLLRVARAFQLPQAFQADLVGAFVTFSALADAPAHEAATHIALGGALAAFGRLLEAHAEALRAVPDDVRLRFERDIGLRFVAAKARARRLEVAFSR